MPLEIRELVIKVNIDEGDSRFSKNEVDDKLQEMKLKIIEECTERIMKKLETSSDR